MDANVIEIEVGDDLGRQVKFDPSGKRLRGRMDFSKFMDPALNAKRNAFPEPVPGMIIGVNKATGQKYHREPLYDPDQKKNRQRIEAKGFALNEPIEYFESESVETWLFWMRRQVDSGKARLITGELPQIHEFEGESKPKKKSKRPRKDFLREVDEDPETMQSVLVRVADTLDVIADLLKKGK